MLKESQIRSFREDAFLRIHNVFNSEETVEPASELDRLVDTLVLLDDTNTWESVGIGFLNIPEVRISRQPIDLPTQLRPTES